MSLPVSRPIAGSIGSFSKKTLSYLGQSVVVPIALLLSMTTLAGAQAYYANTPASITSPIPFTTQDGDSIESVSTTTGALHIEVPLQGIDRHGKSFEWKLTYNSPAFHFDYFPGPSNPASGSGGDGNCDVMVDGTCDSSGDGGSNGGGGGGNQRPYTVGGQWALRPPYGGVSQGNPSNWNEYDPNASGWGMTFTGPGSDPTQNTCPVSGYPYSFTGVVNTAALNYSNFVITGPDAVSHPTNLYVGLLGEPTSPVTWQLYTCSGETIAWQAYTTDGSGIFVDLNAGTARLRDGTLVSSGQSWGVTPNGVFMTNPNQALNGADEDANGNIAPGMEVALIPRLHDANGNARSVQYEYTNVNILTSDCGTVLLLPTGSCIEFPFTFSMLSKVTLPNGQYYQFGYAQNSHGELTSLRLPTGAIIAYTYSPTLYSDGGQQSLDGQSRYEHPMVQTRTITANGVSNTWTYTNWGTAGTGTVTDPNGNCTAHNSTYFGMFGYGTLAETSSAVYAGPCGSSTPLTTTATDYQFDGCPYGVCMLLPANRVGATDMPVANTRPIRVTTTIGGLSKKVETDYENDPIWAGSRELPIEVREFDFGATTPTRVTDYVYLHNPSATPESCAGNAQTFSELPPSQYLALNIVDRPIKKTVCDGSGHLLAQTNYEYDNYSTAMQLPSRVGLHDPAYNPGMTTRGNVTATSVWNSNGGGWITTHYQYDALGNKTAAVDPKGNTTNYSYADLFSNASCLPLDSSNQPLPLYAYPTTVTNALGRQAQTHYTSCTGQVEQAQDANDLAQGRAGTVYTFDLMDHPTSVAYPDGGVTSYNYGNYALPLTVTSTHAPVGSTVSVLDDLGRLSTQTLATGAEKDTSYDALDNVLSVSNWYFPGVSSPTDGYTSYAYDALDRPLLVCNPDNGTAAGNCSVGNSYKQTSYNGNTVTSIDEAGNTWTHTTDAFGELKQVVEPGSLTTLYNYDPLGNLLNVDQQGGSGDTARTRSFSYDSLSRLTSSTNPETGTIAYTYDADSNVSTKTDARGITTSYTYDALNRLNYKTYSDGTLISEFGYDGYDGYGNLISGFTANGIGRLSHISNNISAAYNYAYDAMGRLIHQQGCPPGECGMSPDISLTAIYDLAGNMTDLTYPDGRHVQETFDAAGRLSGSNLVDINGVSTPTSYLQSVTYLPDGSPGITTLGNGVQQAVAKNNRLQVQSMAVTSPLAPFEGQTFLSHAYCYVHCSTGGTANNGNIWGIADAQNAAKTQGFTYDALNRITSFSLGGAPNRQFQIDSFGNMSPMVGGDAVSAFDPATNRIENLPCASMVAPFDAGGNQLCSTDQYGGISQYSYDAESRISQIATLNSASPFVSYVYGADGARVRKSNADGTFTEYVDFGGQPIAEKDENGNWTDYIYAGGKKVASVPGADRVFHTSVVASGSGGLARFDLAIPQNPTGGNYTVQAGDRLCWRQNGQAVYSGMAVWFNNGEDTILQQVYASDGQLTHYRSPSPGWANRCIDLTVGGSDTNSQIVHLALLSYDFTGTSTDWDVYYADMSITSVNGQVIPIINGALPSSASASALNETNLSSELESNPTVDAGAQVATHFLLGDHLGTAQLELSAGGWPVYHGQFAPYGQELQANGSLLQTDAADGSSNHYKFTGKERDSESGLDYFGARYFGSTMGRFMSPDYSDGPDPTPFADLGNPQSLNLYAYVGNNPVNDVDDDGHLDCSGGATQDVACAVTAAAKAVWNFLKGDNSSVTTSQTITVPDPPAPGVPEGAPGTATGPLMQAQQDARNNPHFQPIPGGSTFCNMASCYIGNHVPGTNMDPLMTNGIPNLANTDYNTLAHSGGYHQVGPAEAQRLANTGKVVFGVYKEPGHGHIVTVAPDNTYFGQAYFPGHNGSDPLINDIGRHIGVYPLSKQPSAGFRAGVIFYAQN